MDFRQLLREERRRAREAAQTKSPSLEAKLSEKTTKEHDVSWLWQHVPLKVWTTRSKVEVEEFRRGPIPGVYYIPNFLSPNEEAAILERVYAVPDDCDTWVKLKHRRLQMWGGEVKAPFDPKPLPQWLMQVSETLVDMGIFTQEKKPNHVLINEYCTGDYIMPHEDGPAYFPLVSIISTGAECRVSFERHREADNQTAMAQQDLVQHFNFKLERRSLLLFTGEAYTHYLHSIDNIKEGTRVSLTVRHVDLQ